MAEGFFSSFIVTFVVNLPFLSAVSEGTSQEAS